MPGPLLPVVGVPTTAGTGAEATAVAILDVPEHRVKTGISHAYLRPRLAICDPELTLRPAARSPRRWGSTCSATPSSPTPRWPTTRARGPRPRTRGRRIRARTRSPTCGASGRSARRRRLRRAVADGSDLEARSAMVLARDVRRPGFGNAGVHIPHACSYPIAGLTRLGAARLPGAGRVVPHGFAVMLTAAASFRFTGAPRPSATARAAELLTGAPVDAATRRAAAGHRAADARRRRARAPAELGYGEADVPALVGGRAQAAAAARVRSPAGRGERSRGDPACQPVMRSETSDLFRKDVDPARPRGL